MLLARMFYRIWTRPTREYFINSMRTRPTLFYARCLPAQKRLSLHVVGDGLLRINSPLLLSLASAPAFPPLSSCFLSLLLYLLSLFLLFSFTSALTFPHFPSWYPSLLLQRFHASPIFPRFPSISVFPSQCPS